MKSLEVKIQKYTQMKICKQKNINISPVGGAELNKNENDYEISERSD